MEVVKFLISFSFLVSLLILLYLLFRKSVELVNSRDSLEMRKVEALEGIFHELEKSNEIFNEEFSE